MTRQIEFKVKAAGVGFTLKFRKRTVPNGRHQTLLTLRSENGLEYHSAARLGRSDFGRYDFFAGARIALERILPILPNYGWTDGAIKSLRRQAQIEIALRENMERYNRTYLERESLLAEWENLAEQSRRAAEADFDLAREEAHARVEQARAEAHARVKANLEAATAREGRLRKPDSYKSLNDGQAITSTVTPDVLEALFILAFSPVVK